MKRIINLVLLFGTIISVGIALKYSALPVPIFLSNAWSAFWVSSPEEQQEYVLLYDIAVGFILSALFYFVVEEIPDKVRIHKAKQLVKTQINYLVEYMEQIISVVIQKYDRNRNFKYLAQKDFLILDGEIQYPAEEISYLTTAYYIKGKKRKTAVHQYGNINQLVKNNSKHILDNIAVVKNYEYFYASDSRLVECIRKIEGCALMRYYATDDDKKKNTPCFLLHGTSAAMIDFVNLYLELLKCKLHTEYTVTVLDSKEETERYHVERESGALLQSVIDIQTGRNNTVLTNPTAIISGSKYTTDILVTQLKRRFLAVYIYINDIDIDKLNSFKYIVFIVDSHTRDAIIHILNENNISLNILLLTEQKVIKRRTRDKIKYGNNIIGELFFKIPFKMSYFPFVFFKQEPSEKSIVDLQHKIESILYKGK